MEVLFMHNPIHEDIRLKVEQGYSLTHRVLTDDEALMYTVKYTVDHWNCDKEIIRILSETSIINGILRLNESVTSRLHGTYTLKVKYTHNTTSEIITETIHVSIYK